MTRFIHDQFAKAHFDEFLSSYGQVKTDVKIPGEKREMDILFMPNASSETLSQNLGLLGRLAATEAIFEPFRNPVTTEAICTCLLKALEFRESIQRQAKRKDAPSEALSLPNLWILTPDNLLRIKTLELFYELQEDLKINQNLEEEDRELIMRLKSLYQQTLAQVEQEASERGLQQGLQQGERLVVENLLRARFGILDAELAALIDSILALPPEEFTPLLLHLSREELVATGQPHTFLNNWKVMDRGCAEVG